MTASAVAVELARVWWPARRVAVVAARIVACARGQRSLDGLPGLAPQPDASERGADATVAAERRAEERLAQAEKMEAVGRLAGGVAHDFNNLLLAIRGYTELALHKRANGEEVVADLQEVLRASDRAARLTQQLLVFQRREPVAPEPIDLGEVVGEMESMLRRLIGEDVELVSSTPAHPVTVLADRGQVEQVIANLAINARDAMPHGGRLTIEVTEVEREHGAGARPAPGRHAVLTVADTGCGMDSVTVERIFEPFFSTKGERGTGLGLATVHGIAIRSGGEVVVDSEPDRGSTFSVFLPAHDGPLPRCIDSVATQAARDHTGTTILLVEDDALVRDVVTAMLERYGFTVLAAERGDDAVAVAAGYDGTIELVVADLVLPGLPGTETARRIRERRPAMGILYMSGYADEQRLAAVGRLDESAAFIEKPFTAEDLRQRIEAELDAAGRRSAGGSS